MPCILRLLITTLYSKQSGRSSGALNGLVGRACEITQPPRSVPSNGMKLLGKFQTIC